MLEANKELLRRAWEAYDRGDADGFAACLTDDWCEHEADGSETRIDDERATLARQRVAFPDRHTEIEAIVAEGDLVVTMTETTATHTGLYLDLAPTGRRVRIHQISLHRIRDGRIGETWDEVSGPGFYQQISGRPPPGGS